MNRDIIVFVSPASAGKDYLLNKCVEQFNWNKVVSHTTRIPRIGEHNGKDYWFIDPSEFYVLENDNKFIETTKYQTTTGTWYYGFHKKSVEISGVKCLILNPHGIDQFIEQGYADRMIIVYVVTRSDIRIKRYFNRLGDNPTEHQLAEGFLRLLRDIEDFDKFEKETKYNYENEHSYKNVPLYHILNSDEDEPEYEIEALIDFVNEVNDVE